MEISKLIFRIGTYASGMAYACEFIALIAAKFTHAALSARLLARKYLNGSPTVINIHSIKAGHSFSLLHWFFGAWL